MRLHCSGSICCFIRKPVTNLLPPARSLRPRCLRPPPSFWSPVQPEQGWWHAWAHGAQAHQKARSSQAQNELHNKICVHKNKGCTYRAKRALASRNARRHSYNNPDEWCHYNKQDCNCDCTYNNNYQLAKHPCIKRSITFNRKDDRCNDHLYVCRENGWPHTIMGLLHALIQTLINNCYRGIQLLITSIQFPLAKVCRFYYIGRYSKFF